MEQQITPSDLKNPITNDLIESWYEDGENYDSVFTTLGSAYEECRAECVGLLLCLDKNFLKIFGIDDKKADIIIYANWLSMVVTGVSKCLEMYQPKTSSWMQSHSQARFVILQVLIEAGEGLVTVVEKTGTDGKPDLELALNESKINTVGRKAISDFLLKLQVYKSTADIKSARSMFDKYSAVNNEGQHPWAKWRDIVLDKKQPRKMFVQPNLSLNGEELYPIYKFWAVQLKSYDSSPTGLVQSWIERFQDVSIYEDLESLRVKDKSYFTD
ncbi:Dipeptidyl peptidase 3 [Orchesella cincta]|uniref:Dipeptidyl peptidase 3 n=1 Tax=Orchesella cincta TaxID=48709 RepID=A0A1D2M2L7_ORCCI|nr:Dipeptidyl peptidase 3 [Orchesella cincta]